MTEKIGSKHTAVESGSVRNPVIQKTVRKTMDLFNKLTPVIADMNQRVQLFLHLKR